MNRDIINEFWDDIDAADQEASPDVRKMKLETVIVRIKRAVEAGANSELWYALGYAWYLHPERLRSRDIQTNTVHALETALQQDHQMDMARLYLCHHYYDLHKFDSALQYVESINDRHLDEYMRVKWAEMRACCHIGVYGVARSLSIIKWFVEFCDTSHNDDISPFNLYHAILERAESLNDMLRKELTPLFIRLDELGHLGGWFTGLLEA